MFETVLEELQRIPAYQRSWRDLEEQRGAHPRAVSVPLQRRRHLCQTLDRYKWFERRKWRRRSVRSPAKCRKANFIWILLKQR